MFLPHWFKHDDACWLESDLPEAALSLWLRLWAIFSMAHLCRLVLSSCVRMSSCLRERRQDADLTSTPGLDTETLGDSKAHRTRSDLALCGLSSQPIMQRYATESQKYQTRPSCRSTEDQQYGSHLARALSIVGTVQCVCCYYSTAAEHIEVAPQLGCTLLLTRHRSSFLLQRQVLDVLINEVSS